MEVIPTFSGIQFRQAVPADREAFREALATLFYADEPLTISYYQGSEVTDDDMAYSLSLIEEGFVWLAVEEETGQIVGLSGGEFCESDEAEQLISLAGQTESKKFADILRLLGKLSKEGDLFRRFGVSKAYHVHFLAVHSRMRGRSMGKILMEKQFEYARKCNVKVVCADVTGFYSEKLCKSLGMECIQAIAYSTLKDDAGEPMFLAEEPHVYIQSMVKIL
ncbi:arylalkylamine N-acetyltransferase-like 2 [Armigeres subalbatus]|uniref:arylalkylamine N-acetyltransferase-like 2 n=1 Tax=Armigeres subalbatus TaxID=124917 RepID=UPI002ED04F57